MKEVRKVRGDAKLERLSAAQQDQLLVWLDDENRTYLEVVGLVQAKFGLKVDRSAVAGYWRRHVMPERCRDEAATAAELAALPDGEFVEAMLKLAKQQAWYALSQPQPDVRQAAAMMSLVHGAERADLARRRMALAERRASAKSLAPVQTERTPPPPSAAFHPPVRAKFSSISGLGCHRRRCAGERFHRHRCCRSRKPRFARSFGKRGYAGARKSELLC